MISSSASGPGRTLSSGSVAHNTSCTLSVDVQGTVEGDGNNTTGTISSTEGGTGTASNNLFTVRALAYIIAGHMAHHIRILREFYL